MQDHLRRDLMWAPFSHRAFRHPRQHVAAEHPPNNMCKTQQGCKTPRTAAQASLVCLASLQANTLPKTTVGLHQTSGVCRCDRFLPGAKGPFRTARRLGVGCMSGCQDLSPAASLKPQAWSVPPSQKSAYPKIEVHSCFLPDRHLTHRGALGYFQAAFSVRWAPEQ